MIVKATLVLTPNGYHYLALPTQDAEILREKFGKRVLCTAVGGGTIHCALQKNKNLGYYISVGKKTKQKLGIEPGPVELKIEADNTPYQMEMPEALEEVLLTDPDALSIFESLTDGAKRSIMHMVDSAKRVETQVNRAIKITENLKLGFRKPSELLK